jgi:hypothetical protein
MEKWKIKKIKRLALSLWAPIFSSSAITKNIIPIAPSILPSGLRIANRNNSRN